MGKGKEKESKGLQIPGGCENVVGGPGRIRVCDTRASCEYSEMEHRLMKQGQSWRHGSAYLKWNRCEDHWCGENQANEKLGYSPKDQDHCSYSR